MKHSSFSKFTNHDATKATLITVFSLLFSFQILAYPGQLDLAFRSVLMEGSSVKGIEVQTDGKVLIAGSFTTRGAIVRKNLARLNADGSIDPTFNAGEFPVQVIKLQNDGKILIGGIGLLKRLNTNGSVDSTFNLTGITIPVTEGIEIQPDGKILVNKRCGFELGCGEGLKRLNSDGSVDLVNGSPFSFSSGGIYSVRYVPIENKILVGGNITYTINGMSYKGLVRLNLNGTIDPTFTAQLSKDMSNFVSTDAQPLPNGNILIWGDFDTVDQATRHGIAVLNSNGTVDTSFVPAINNSPDYFRKKVTVYSVALQSNGKILVGGYIDINVSQGFQNYPYLARLNTDGSFDFSFSKGKNTLGFYLVLKIHNDNRLLIGGIFSKYNGLLRQAMAQVKLF